MPANVTFLLVEGPHDAEFMARLLKLRGFEQRTAVSDIPDIYRRLIPRDYPAKDEKGILLTFTLTNKGKMDAMESVQAYVEGISGCVRRLAAIDKVFLCAGDARKISLHLDWHELCIIRPEGERVRPQGSLLLTVGGSQPDARSLALGATPCCFIDIEV